MKKQLNARERLKLCSISFMKAMKPKINRSGKKKQSTQHRSSTILMGRMERQLNAVPGTV